MNKQNGVCLKEKWGCLCMHMEGRNDVDYHLSLIKEFYPFCHSPSEHPPEWVITAELMLKRHYQILAGLYIFG